MPTTTKPAHSIPHGEDLFARILMEHMQACYQAYPGQLTTPVDRAIGERGRA